MDGYRIVLLIAAGVYYLLLLPAQLLLVRRRAGVNAVVGLRTLQPAALVDAAAAGILWMGLLAYVLIYTLWPRGYEALAPLRLAAWLRPLGAAVGIPGLALIVAGYRTMGESYRVGIDRTAPAPLVTRGIFRHLRHPIYVGLVAALAGLFLIAPSLFSLCLWVAGSAAMIVQACREEAALIEQHGKRYLDYAARTGRFFPHLRRPGRADLVSNGRSPG